MNFPLARLGLATVLALLIAASPLAAQRELSGTAEIKLALDRLNVLGSVLMIAAHPDDENTALLAYLARGRHLRTAYLSATRGEGGQNLIGPEQGDLMGIIRTQELLAARRVDGAEQYFTRAIDFGYSKTAEETLTKWGREEVLGDMVWVIRTLRPDVIVLRSDPTSTAGHGHHQAAAILGQDAFRVAADPKRFPDQLKWAQPWQAKRLMLNTFSRGGPGSTGTQDRISVDAGEYNPVLGFSYGEIAGMSRSQHKSQGFGAAERKGSQINSFVLLDGEAATSSLFDGIDTTWNRVPGGASVGSILAEAARQFQPEQPEKTVPLLLKARALIARIDHPWASLKLTELDETIALTTGLWLDASAENYATVPGTVLRIEAEALNRSNFPVRLLDVELDGAGGAQLDQLLDYNQPFSRSLTWQVPSNQQYSQPYWLREPKQGTLYTIEDRRKIGQPDVDPVLTARFRLRVGDQEIVLIRPVIYRWVDRVRGELTRSLTIVPAVAIEFVQTAVLFPSEKSRKLDVQITANKDGAAGQLRLEAPNGWRATPASQSFQIGSTSEQVVLSFEVTPPAEGSMAEIKAIAEVGDIEISSGMRIIDYEHIPPQTLTPPARADLVRVDATTLARNIGYIMGAGDTVPDALRQLGCDVTLLEAGDLSRGDLSRFDTIVTGVRAYNVRDDLRANQRRLLSYVENGGTLLVQYNVPGRGFGGGNESDPLAQIGPYPLTISSGRVSVEEASMRFLNPGHPLLASPNRITEADFEGWVQERGLYFATKWDERYEPLWEANDPGESPLSGGTLFARYGSGAYVFTGLSWFRQLPAGVPGAYRIFANLLSAGKIVQ